MKNASRYYQNELIAALMEFIRDTEIPHTESKYTSVENTVIRRPYLWEYMA